LSGHNKWSTIKHKKGKADAIRGKLFTKLIKEITVAARMGGGDESSNARLRTAIAAAKGANMPSDNVTRAIKKGTGELEGVAYEEVVYEGYGPEGVAILVKTLTDNRNRTVSEIRHAFAKHAGKMAEPGAVSWIFSDAGQILVAPGASEDALMELVMEHGGEDLITSEDGFEIRTSMDVFETVRAAVEAGGFEIVEAGLTKFPSNTVQVEGRPAQTLVKLLSALEELDDTQDVYGNFEMDDKYMEDDE